MDQMVLETQKWLNKTYSFETGMVPQDGKTGWRTIYALRRALQQEMGITATSDNFGPTTERYFKEKVEPTFKDGGTPKVNIVKILQGGFWCKGINPGVSGTNPLDGKYTKYTKDAVSEFQEMAGLKPDGYLTAMLMKALLDMSAFSLLGDPKIRLMQQELNRNYNEYFGLLPCDGIYQRDTNQAIIYGLQCEMGMFVGYANGYFGPGTTVSCPTINIGHPNKANIKLLQYALYVNDEYKGPFDGIFTQQVADAVRSFRKFMKIGDVERGSADMPVIKALLATTGDTERPSNACDTSMQILKQSHVDLLKNAGYNTIGRYLTGTVGVGAQERPKNLTVNEINLLKKNNFKIFPIYQDGGWYLEYFKTAGQGWTDARLAGAAAKSLGFKDHTTIYFACDFDVLGDEIPYIIAYLRDVVDSMRQHYPEYKVSLYAPRNVCAQATDQIVQITNCFVSDMSSGFSANLGYKMPRNWSFDQYNEYELQGIPLDKVAMSGLFDVGQSTFNAPQNVDKQGVSSETKTAKEAEIANEIANRLKAFRKVVGLDFKSEIEHTVYFGQIKMTLKLENEISSSGDADAKFVIKNGKPEIKFAKKLEELQNALDIVGADDSLVETINQLADIANEGEIQVRFKADSFTEVGMEIYFTGSYVAGNIDGQDVPCKYQITLGIFVDPSKLPPGMNADVDRIQESMKRVDAQLKVAGFVGLTGLALCGGFVVASGVSFGTAVATTGTSVIQSVASFFAALKVIG